MWSIKQSFTSPYHPQTDGMVERFNRTLANMLSCYVRENQKNWDLFLPYVLFAYRTSAHSVTRHTPFFLLYGRDPKTPLQSGINFDQSKYIMDLDDYKSVMLTGFYKAWHSAKKNIEDAQGKYIGNPAKDNPYKVGQLVRIFQPTNKKGLVGKLCRNWQGPFRILTIAPPVLMLQSLVTRKRKCVHMSRCKRLKDSYIPSL